MEKTSIQNAKITSTRLGEEYGCLTVDLIIEGEGWGCGFGGYCLDHWFSEIGQHNSSDGYGAIIELMKTLDVESWEELKDKYVRVEIEGWGGKIIKIGHLMKDKWFSFQDYFDTVHALNQNKADND